MNRVARRRAACRGVYCAGEITGIGGLDAALVEGQIAGFAATGQTAAAHSLFRKRAAARSFAGAMRRAFALRAELRSLPEPDTFVCRCEDVNLRRISSHASWKAAKLRSAAAWEHARAYLVDPRLSFSVVGAWIRCARPSRRRRSACSRSTHCASKRSPPEVGDLSPCGAHRIGRAAAPALYTENAISLREVPFSV